MLSFDIHTNGAFLKSLSVSQAKHLPEVSESVTYSAYSIRHACVHKCSNSEVVQIRGADKKALSFSCIFKTYLFLLRSSVSIHHRRYIFKRKVAGSIPSRDRPKVVKRWFKQLPCLRSALKGECLEIWLVVPVSAYNVTGRVHLSSANDRSVPVGQHSNLSHAGTVSI